MRSPFLWLNYGKRGKDRSADVGDWRVAWVELFPGWALEPWLFSGPVLTGVKTTRPSFSPIKVWWFWVSSGPVRCELTFCTDVLSVTWKTRPFQNRNILLREFLPCFGISFISPCLSLSFVLAFLFSENQLKEVFVCFFDRADSRVSGEMLCSSLQKHLSAWFSSFVRFNVGSLWILTTILCLKKKNHVFPHEASSLGEIVRALVVSYCGIQQTNSLGSKIYGTGGERSASVSGMSVSPEDTLFAVCRSQPGGHFPYWVQGDAPPTVQPLSCFLKWKHRQKLAWVA